MQQIAIWNTARSVWETDQGMLCGHSDVFSEIWPTAGMTRGGVAYQLRPWAPLTNGSGSSLLPTPRTSDTNGAGPRATDGTKGGPNQRGSSGDLMLPSAVQLLPTPTAMDSHSSGGSTPANVTLTDAVIRSSLGARTNPRFAAGNESPAAQLLPLDSPDSGAANS